MPELMIPQHSPADVRRSETQGILTLHEVPAGDEAKINQSLLQAGALAIEGDYVCYIDTHDWSAFEVVLMPSAVTGTITPVVDRMYANRQQIRSTTSGVAFVAGSAQTIAVTTVAGTQRFQLRIAVGAGESVTFAPGTNPAAQTALAEFNGA